MSADSDTRSAEDLLVAGLVWRRRGACCRQRAQKVRGRDDGTLVAVRVWAASTFQDVWLSPEGHVLHVNPATNIITVSNESGQAVPVSVDANTQFFFRTPQSALSDATPIGTGTGFLASHDLARGFKVHVAVVDPLATPLVAQSVRPR